MSAPARNYVRARDAGLIACEQCRKLCALPPDESHPVHCPRCDSRLHPRKFQSLQRSWALIVTAAILLIPANTLHIMTVTSFGQGDPDTIMSGIVKLWQNDLQAIAIIVFIASVFVPIFKLAGIALLMLVVHWRLPLSAQQCMWLYRFIYVIGRWSMLDLFMISILVTLVNLGNIASVSSEPGATAFAAVVVLTLLAAENVDPRLIWDLEHE